MLLPLGRVNQLVLEESAPRRIPLPALSFPLKVHHALVYRLCLRACLAWQALRPAHRLGPTWAEFRRAGQSTPGSVGRWRPMQDQGRPYLARGRVIPCSSAERRRASDAARVAWRLVAAGAPSVYSAVEYWPTLECARVEHARRLSTYVPVVICTAAFVCNSVNR